MKKKYDIKKLERAFSEDFSSPLYSMLANIYFNKKDFDRAYTVCKIGLEHHPDDIAGQFILAKTHLFKNNIVKSKLLLNRILTQFPLHINARKLIIEIFKNENNKNKLDYHKKQLLEFSPINLDDKKVSKPVVKKAASKKASKPAAKKAASKKVSKPEAKKATSKKVSKPVNAMKRPFVIDKKMATFTLVNILVKQRHLHEALKVLDILDKEGKAKKKIQQKRNSIKKMMEM